jgi:hypothetical protein
MDNNSIIPISQEALQPIIKSNILYVNCIEEFEKIELECNQTILAFDNNQSCFYVRARDRFGEYAPVKVYFYEDQKTTCVRSCCDDASQYKCCSICFR